MENTVRVCEPSDYDDVRRILATGDLGVHFDIIKGPLGLERLLANPFLPAEALWIAHADGRPAGFAFAFLFEQPAGPHVAVRVGVVPELRRRGIGRRLREAAEGFAATQTRMRRVHDVSLAAWMPNPAAEALVARAGYTPERTFWLMTRPRGTVPAAVWPAGVTLQTFDCSERMYADASDAYNTSFAQHWRFVHGTVEELRSFVSRPGFRNDGYVLAYRDGRCVGYCRNELWEARGEVGLIGTTPDARGIGLGRALLRWGVEWLQNATPNPITLLVDGENENALRLYRSEGFEVTRTRQSWCRLLDPAS